MVMYSLILKYRLLEYSMPLLDLGISVINNFVNNCIGMEVYIFHYDMKEIYKG